MAREKYARGCYWSEKLGISLHPGVQVLPGDDVDGMTRSLKALAHLATVKFGSNHDAAAEWVEEKIKLGWPGRAYFIESDEDGRGVQIWDPAGFVKERCDCPCRTR